MATCAYCGETIVFGGVKAGDLRFCNGKCLDKARVLAASAPVPDEAVADLARRIHSGPCLRCQGPGPVDVHMAYWVWSALAFTRWGNRQQVSCRGCAARSQAGRLALSAVFGWRGFPWGLVMTPVQVGRTAMALAAPPNPTEPSARLCQVARAYLMAQSRSNVDGAEKSKPDRDRWEEWV